MVDIAHLKCAAFGRAGSTPAGDTPMMDRLDKLLPKDFTVARVTPATVKGSDVEQQAEKDNM